MEPAQIINILSPSFPKRLPARPSLNRRRLARQALCARRVMRVAATAADEKVSEKLLGDYKTYTLPIYVRPDVVLVEGKGSTVVDSEGKEYLDFSGGIAVNALGHGDRRVIDAVHEQAEKLIHASNLFHTQPAIDLAKRLVQHSFADKVYFCNSGTEATEGAIKFARKWANVHRGVDPYDPATVGPYEIVSFSAGFHGRTMGALSITPKEKIQAPFLPMLPGHQVATFNDLDSARSVIQPGKTCAVIVEPVQGEAGVRLATTEFLQGLRRLCDERGSLLIFDEVQCGVGRTGRLWAHLHHGVEPDIMTLAKPLGGGLPIGAVLLKQHVADVMSPGDHGSTFAGNPLVCHVANTVFDIVSDPDFLQQVELSGRYLHERLSKALSGHSSVQEIRHSGLLIGIQCDGSVAEILGRAIERGLIVISAGQGDVIRIAPPLNVTHEEIDECVSQLEMAFHEE